MTKVRVYKMPKGAAKAELLALLKVTGCFIVEEDEECAFLIVILDNALLQDKELEGNLLEATQAGCRVIGIWPNGTDGAQVPDCYENYRYATVVWDPTSLRYVLAGKALHDTATGQPIAYPQTRRNKC